MSTGRELFVNECNNLQNLAELPSTAILGDVCRHQGHLWVYSWDIGETSDGYKTLVGKWLTFEDANNRVIPIEFSAPIRD